MTARSRRRTASTSTATCRRTGATTTRGRRRTRPARRTGAPAGLRAGDAGRRRSVRPPHPEFLVNYHSAAELLLHGVGWQVATPSPDDVIYEAMLGDDAEPAVPGYDPDISAELYTTNGETDTHAQDATARSASRPRCRRARRPPPSDPDDSWEPEDCGSVFEFPDDEKLVRQEVEKNFPLALAVAASAAHPDEPVSVVGRTAEDFRLDTFSVSYGDPQTVSVWAKRALTEVTLHYQVDGGAERTGPVEEWAGGERYGAEINDYYAELRGRSRGGAGSAVEVWFTGQRPDGSVVESERRFTYTLEQDSGNSTLVIANEDYTGVNPDYPPRDRPSTSTTTSPRWRPTASPPTPGTWTRRACRTTSACSATTTRWSGTWATTGSPRTPRTS